MESVLSGHPAVSTSVVGSRGDRLVAWVEVRPGASVTVAELRSYLLSRLPSALVAEGWSLLERMPQTTSGKVDRSRLPEPEWSEGVPTSRPRGEVETLLAGVFEEVLGVSEVGRETSFFAAGGHSLTAARAMGRVGSLWSRSDDPCPVGASDGAGSGGGGGFGAGAGRSGSSAVAVGSAHDELASELRAAAIVVVRVDDSERRVSPFGTLGDRRRSIGAVVVWSLRELWRRHGVLRAGRGGAGAKVGRI